MAMGRRHEMARQIEAASSSSLTERLCSLDHQQRSAVVSMHARLVLSVCDQLSMKLSMWDDLPFKLLAALGECVGIQRSKCQEAVRSCLDMVPDMSKKHLLHRVAARFLLPGQPLRSELETFCNSGWAIWECAPNACRELVGYAFTLLVEVRLEGEHSRIHSIGKRAQTGQLRPATVSAGLRKANIDRLGNDFQKFCEVHWNAKFGPFVVKRLLSHVVAPAKLAVMTQAQVFSRIFMYDTESQFEASWGHKEESAEP